MINNEKCCLLISSHGFNTIFVAILFIRNLEISIVRYVLQRRYCSYSFYDRFVDIVRFKISSKNILFQYISLKRICSFVFLKHVRRRIEFSSDTNIPSDASDTISPSPNFWTIFVKEIDNFIFVKEIVNFDLFL